MLGQCDLLKEPICNKLLHFPYVCNTCENKMSCKKLKRYYDPDFAQELTDSIKSSSRKNIKVSQNDLAKMDKVVSPAIQNGQSIYHIWNTNQSIKSIISDSTLKRYVYDGRFSAGPYLLPMKKRFDPVRKSTIIKRRKAVIQDDLIRSFVSLIELLQSQNNSKDYWEYDSVIGKLRDTKAILTITYVEFDFQFGLVIQKDNPDEVIQKIRKLQELLGDKFWEIFKINLADNGIEFNRFTEMEWDEQTGEVKCKTFFTRPHCPSDKGDCENNHKYVRYIFPKHESLEFLTQEQCNLAFSHINALSRKSKDGKTPYDLFVKRFGTEVADLLGIKHVKAKDVCLKPFLIKK